MIEDKDTEFLRWLLNRLRYLHKEDVSILSKLEDILVHLSQPVSISIEQKDLDKILNKYYTDFFMDKSENWGFSEEDRERLRKQMICLCEDMVNRNIPKKELLK